MYITGAHIVSTYSGMPFRDFVQKRIFDPLQMTYTTYRANGAEASGLLSQGWGIEGRRLPYQFADESLSEFIAGAGGILSNTIDMVRPSASDACVTLSRSPADEMARDVAQRGRHPAHESPGHPQADLRRDDDCALGRVRLPAQA